MKRAYARGFTIVELLVVIVVTGVLAAITIVTYAGITDKAVQASLQSDLTNASQLLKMDLVSNTVYPASLSTANGGQGVKSSPGTTLQYAYDNTSSPPTYCLSATNGTTSYKITESTKPIAGDCVNYKQVLSFDAGNVASYPGSGTTWTDLSGQGNNGTLVGGVTYTSANGGALTFDGISGFVRIPNSSSLNPGTSSWSTSTWFKMNSAGTYTASILYNKELMYEASPGGGHFTYAWQPSWTWYNAAPVVNGQWYNFVVVYDKGTQYVYQNGALAYSRPQTGSMGSNANEFDIGARGAGTSNFISATISVFKMYNRPLSPDEITSDFNLLRSRYGI